MRSFRLYLGERTYLTPVGWASLLLAVVASIVAGVLWAGWLADRIGAGELLMWVVAGAGLTAWSACLIAFRAAGFPLTARLPEAAPNRPWHRPHPLSETRPGSGQGFRDAPASRG